MNKAIRLACLFLLPVLFTQAQKRDLLAAAASVSGDLRTGWTMTAADLRSDQYLLLTLQTPASIGQVTLQVKGVSAADLRKGLDLYVTYDPMNPGSPVGYTVTGQQAMVLSFPKRYGAYIKLLLKGGLVRGPITVSDPVIGYAAADDEAG